MFEGEKGYLDTVQYILDHGLESTNRTGTNTISCFGVTMKFSLENSSFPLLTTKRVPFRLVAEELLWFINSCTNAKVLSEKGVDIWNANGSRAFLDDCNLPHREEGDLGPIYGFQWRHFNAPYTTCHDDYDNKGFDQLQWVIDEIKSNPSSRRLVVSAWNPLQISEMVLPPCHTSFQFYVRDHKLSCLLYQRSGDMGLGVPFNIASYSLLTRMVALLCDLECGEFVHVIGDAHIYTNHIIPLQKQLKRIPKPPPKLKFVWEVDSNSDYKSPETIDDFVIDHFVIEGYHPYKTIKMKMVV
jgi:thymidylate synthase